MSEQGGDRSGCQKKQDGRTKEGREAIQNDRERRTAILTQVQEIFQITLLQLIGDNIHNPKHQNGLSTILYQMNSETLKHINKMMFFSKKARRSSTSIPLQGLEITDNNTATLQGMVREISTLLHDYFIEVSLRFSPHDTSLQVAKTYVVRFEKVE